MYYYDAQRRKRKNFCPYFYTTKSSGRMSPFMATSTSWLDSIWSLANSFKNERSSASGGAPGVPDMELAMFDVEAAGELMGIRVLTGS